MSATTLKDTAGVLIAPGKGSLADTRELERSAV